MDVSDGYARKFLCRRKLATPADAQASTRRASRKAPPLIGSFRRTRRARHGKAARRHRRYGQGQGRRKRPSLRRGHGQEIAAALLEQKQVEIDKKKIALADPIRALGEYNVSREPSMKTPFASVKVIVEKC